MRCSRQDLILGFIILIGFALRVYLLNDVTLSPDERNVANEFLRIPLSDLLQATTRHGFPEHILAGIFIWIAYKLGWQLFILRWPGIVFSMLTLAATYKLTQKMIGSAAALAAVFLLALSYYHILFSHQIRGYAAMVFLAVGSFYFLWQGLTRRRWRDWLWFALAMALSIYNQFYAFTLLATQGLIVAIWLALRLPQYRSRLAVFWRQQVLPPLLAGLGSVAIAAMLFAPLLPKFFRSFVAADSDFTASPVSLADSLYPYYYLFYQYSGGLSAWAVLLYAALLLAGVIYLGRLKPEAAGILAGWLVIPLLLVVAGQSLVSWFYARERYLIYILPAFILLAAAGWAGLVRLARWLSPPAGIGFLGLSLALITAVSLAASFTYLQTATEGNWQATADFLAHQGWPADLVMCEPFAHGWKEVDLDATDECTRNITYRLKQQAPFIYPIYNLYAVATQEALRANPVLLQRNPRLWVVVWGLPAGLTYQGLAPAATFQRLGQTVVLGPITEANVVSGLIQALQQVNLLMDDPATEFALLLRLADLQAAAGQTDQARQTLWSARQIMPDDRRAENQAAAVAQRLAQPPLILAPEHNLSTDFGHQILLNGYSLSPGPPQPGQPGQLTLFWQALAAVDSDYSVFLHLRNQANQTVAQFDFAPRTATSTWWQGDVLHDTVTLALPAQLPPGQYRLLMGLYNLQTLERLPVEDDRTGENAVELMQVVIPD